MEKEFIPYEQALALKEIGFESPYPIGGYQEGSIFYYEKGKLHYDGQPMYSSNYHDGQILAPLYQQAFRFFRERYNLFSYIGRCAGVLKESYFVEIYTISECVGIYDKDENQIIFNSYKKAELKCIKKLIDICTNSNTKA